MKRALGVLEDKFYIPLDKDETTFEGGGTMGLQNFENAFIT